VQGKIVYHKWSSVEGVVLDSEKEVWEDLTGAAWKDPQKSWFWDSWNQEGKSLFLRDGGLLSFFQGLQERLPCLAQRETFFSVHVIRVELNLFYAFLISPIQATCSIHLNHLHLVTIIIYGEPYKLWSSSLCNFLQPPITYFLLGPNILLHALFLINLNILPLMWEVQLLFCIF